MRPHRVVNVDLSNVHRAFIIKTKTLFLYNSKIKKKSAIGFGFGGVSFRSAPVAQRMYCAKEAAFEQFDLEESEPSMPEMEHATAEVFILSPWRLW